MQGRTAKKKDKNINLLISDTFSWRDDGLVKKHGWKDTDLGSGNARGLFFPSRMDVPSLCPSARRAVTRLRHCFDVC